MLRFNETIALLKQHYGEPQAPPAKGPFELVMWENACYLLPDERRLEVFEALREKVGLNAAATSTQSSSCPTPRRKKLSSNSPPSAIPALRKFCCFRALLPACLWNRMG